jgi:K+-transporting ATPase KdpF subunit
MCRRRPAGPRMIVALVLAALVGLYLLAALVRPERF